MTMIWCNPIDDDEYTDVTIESEEWSQSGISWVDCKPVVGTFPDVTLKINASHPPRDFLQSGTFFTVSNRLKSILEEFQVRAEFFPIRIMYEKRDYQEQTYYYCNILDCVDCFDRTRGEYTFWDKAGFTDRVNVIKKLAIDDNKAAGHDLFRIAKGGEYIVCTSDRVADRMIEQKIRGLILKKPEEWNGM